MHITKHLNIAMLGHKHVLSREGGIEIVVNELATRMVPIYKVEKFIRKCIDSILNQSFADFELILVDDGSPDNCPSICDEYAARDDRVKADS